MSSILAPFQLLELNIISAQDLFNVSRNMRTYAVSWVHPDRKLTTRVDTNGRTNPTWNDKFVFRVDEEFLHADTSAVMIEIYALHWFRDVHVGTIRVLVGNLIPPPSRPNHGHNYLQLGMRFVALQVRRPSGRPQGILNIGVALLDSTMRSMPLYTQLDNASAVGFRHLMGEEDPHLYQHSHGHDHHHHVQQSQHTSTYGRPELRRTKSDTSSMLESTANVMTKQRTKKKKKKASSVISGSEILEITTERKKESSIASSMISGSEFVNKGIKVKSGSIINGSEVIGDPPKKGKDSFGPFGSIITNNSEVMDPPKKKKNGKSGFIVNGSEMEDPQKKGLFGSIITNSEVMDSEVMDPPKKKKNGKSGSIVNGSEMEDPPKKKKNGKSGSIVNGLEMEDPPKKGKDGLFGSIFTKSEVIDPPKKKKNGKSGSNGLETEDPPKKVSNEVVVVSPPMRSKGMNEKPIMKYKGLEFGSPYKPVMGLYGLEYGTPRRPKFLGRPIITESELGPSPSEVAAAMAKNPYQPPVDDIDSFVGGSEVESSVEGLRSKLERWRSELPPVYDIAEFSSFPSSKGANVTSVGNGNGNGNGNGSKHKRRHTDSGLFSCFSNICGCECSIVCGGSGSNSGSVRKTGNSGRGVRSPINDDISYV